MCVCLSQSHALVCRFTWSDLFDKASACGKPLGDTAADKAGLVWTRAFAGCKVTLTCHNKTLPDCVGDITYTA